MRSNYKIIGDFIRPVKNKNTDGHISDLQGINIDKYYMPSVANIIGVDLKKYKVVKKNQFACNRMHVGRDKRLPVALLKTVDEIIVSPAYDVFEITDKKVLLPEYLMMWFSRKEFDRNCWFHTDADVRGGLSWDALCNIKLPVPSPEKQQEIINEYNTVINRMQINEQLIQKLEETAQAIYREWFMEFEFPNENGKPYKSNGGEMVWCEVLGKDIPKGWRTGTLNELVDIIDGDRGKNYPSIDEMLDKGYCLFLNAGNVTKIGFDFSETKFISKEKDEKLRKGKLKRNDIVLTSRGTVGNVAFFSDAILFSHIRINSGMVIMRAKDFSESTIFIYSMLRNYEMKKEINNYLSGSAQPQLPIKDLIKIPILIPENIRIIEFERVISKFQNLIDLNNNQNKKISELKELLLSSLAV